MPVRPVGLRILIERTERSDKTKSGIFIAAGDNSEQPNQGKVLGLGRQCTDEIKVGEQIAYARFSPTGMDHGGKSLLFVMERDVLGVIDDA